LIRPGYRGRSSDSRGLSGTFLGFPDLSFSNNFHPGRLGSVESWSVSAIGKPYRTRYFTDSGIIGSKEFVSDHYCRFKDLFMSKNEKIPRPVAGLDGMYSLKRLSEVIP